jgi:aryl-alcohol dehydrogenase-like predicted oxidoreductase
MNMAKQVIVKGYNGDIVLDSRILRIMPADEKDVFDLMNTFAALGGRVFETAAVYGDFENTGDHKSERIIAKWLKKQPNINEFKVITKGGHHSLSAPKVSRVTPECVSFDIERSLQAFNGDAIDIYLLHRDNSQMPVGDIMECLNAFIVRGEIRAIGTANWTVKRIKEANAYALEHNLQPFCISEVQWGLAVPLENTTDEVEMTKEEYRGYLDLDIPVITEDVLQNNSFAEWFNDESMIPAKYYSRATRVTFEAAKRICKEKKIKPENIPYAYIFNNKLNGAIVTTAPAGKNIAILQDFMDAVTIKFDTDESEVLDYPRVTNGCLYKGVKRLPQIETIVIHGGKEDYSISKIICGTSNIGTKVNEETAFNIFDAYYEAGGRTFDTALVYGSWGEGRKSHSELILGRWIKSRNIRKDVRIITKGCHPDMRNIKQSRVSAPCIRDDIASSLQNLDTDYIDIYQLHRDNTDVPVEEIMDCLNSFVAAGTLCSISASNWTTGRIEAANVYARSRGFAEFSSSEVHRSLAVLNQRSMGQDIPDVTEDDLIYYSAHTMPILAWGSLAGGYIIKGVQNRMDTIAPGFLGQFKNPASDQRIRNTKAVVRDSGISADELCVSYITSDPVTSAAITGAGSPEQIKKIMAASTLVIPGEMIADLAYLPIEVIDEMKNGSPGYSHPLEKTFDIDMPLKDIFDERFHNIVTRFFGNIINKDAEGVNMAMNMTLRRLMEIPGAEVFSNKEKVHAFIDALNKHRLKLLAEKN